MKRAGTEVVKVQRALIGAVRVSGYKQQAANYLGGTVCKNRDKLINFIVRVIVRCYFKILINGLSILNSLLIFQFVTGKCNCNHICLFINL